MKPVVTGFVDKYVKECRARGYFETCEEEMSTDETAHWYNKGKYKCYDAHQIGLSQLAESGAPLGCVVLNGKRYEPDSLEPLLTDVVQKHPELEIHTVNADGIFNSQACRDTVQEKLISAVCEMRDSIITRKFTDSNQWCYN